MKHLFITLACVLLLALTYLVPEASAQDTPSGRAPASIQATHEAPMLVAHRTRRHCHLVAGHYIRRHGRLVYVRPHRHCHHVHRYVG